MKVLQKAFSQVPSCLPGGFSEAGLSNSNVRNVRAAEALVTYGQNIVRMCQLAATSEDERAPFTILPAPSLVVWLNIC